MRLKITNGISFTRIFPRERFFSGYFDPLKFSKFYLQTSPGVKVSLSSSSLIPYNFITVK